MKSRLFGVLLFAGGVLLFGCDSDDPVTAPEPVPPLNEFVIQSSDYLNHRFFRLDLPWVEPGGRVPGDRIDVQSIRVFKILEPGIPQVGDLLNVAVYVDSLGFRGWGAIDFAEPYLFGGRCREFYNWKLLLTDDGEFLALDLEVRFKDEDVLAVVYEIREADGGLVQVGDRPGIDPPEQSIPGVNGLFYRVKLLKAPVSMTDLHAFGYVLRNIYSLGGRNLDHHNFALRIERSQPGDGDAWRDESGLDYIRIFGLDRDNSQGTGTPDGLVDFYDFGLFDLERGLLKFPPDHSRPFAPAGRILTEGDTADRTAEALYAGFADTSAFVWNPSYLRHNQAWEIYDPAVYPVDYPAYSAFRIIATYPVEEP